MKVSCGGQLSISRVLIRWQLAWNYRVLIQRGRDSVAVWKKKKKKKAWGKNWATFCPPSHRHDTRVPLKWRQSFLEGNSLASTPDLWVAAPNMCMEAVTDDGENADELSTATWSATTFFYICQLFKCLNVNFGPGRFTWTMRLQKNIPISQRNMWRWLIAVSSQDSDIKLWVSSCIFITVSGKVKRDICKILTKINLQFAGVSIEWHKL